MTAAMPVSKTPPKDPFLSKAFRISLGIHLSLILVALLQGPISMLLDFTTAEEKEALKKSQLAKQAIRVDMVDLPRYKLSDMPQMDLTQEVGEEKLEASKDDTKTPEPTESAMKLKDDELAKAAKAKAEMEKKAQLDARAQEKRGQEEKERLNELRARLRAALAAHRKPCDVAEEVDALAGAVVDAKACAVPVTLQHALTRHLTEWR